MEENNNWITWIIVIALVYSGYSFFGGDKSSESEYTSQSNYNTANSIYSSYNSDYESYGNDKDLAPEPENPYGEGSGHYAGYEWAVENEVDSCDGNSDSFIEGCEEYLLQREEYEN